MDVISENNQITLYPDYLESKRIFSENKIVNIFRGRGRTGNYEGSTEENYIFFLKEFLSQIKIF